MNEFTFQDIASARNMERSFTVTITQEMMSDFLKITGDSNPMHVDSDYAKSNGFKDTLVYGLLTNSFYSTLAGVYLPGKYCLLQEVAAQFRRNLFEVRLERNFL